MTPVEEPIETQHFKFLIGLGVLFGVIGALLLLPSFAATNDKAFEAEGGDRSGKQQVSSGATSGGSFVTLNNSTSGGGTVPLPTAVPSGSGGTVVGDLLYGTVGCHTSEPICIFGWQNDDLYDANGANAFCACMQMRNVQTGAVIKEFSANGGPGGTINGNRPLAIHNPDDNEWLIIYHATPVNGDTSQSQLYGVRIDASGNYIGSTLSLSDTSMRGWVPKGVYDTTNHKYYLQWHQSISDYHTKDMYATVVDRTGAITDKAYNINKTQETLTEYGSVAFNATNGEILSIASEGAAESGSCGENCTRKLVGVRLKIDAYGKLTEVGRFDIDTDQDVEWGISMAYNKTADSYVVTYREGSTGRMDGGLTRVYAMVLNGTGGAKASPVQLSGSTIDHYWVTGTGCSSQTNICVSTFIDQGVYVDAASTGTTKIGQVGAHGAGNFTWNGSKVAYVAATDTFTIFGAGKYISAPGR